MEEVRAARRQVHPGEAPRTATPPAPANDADYRSDQVIASSAPANDADCGSDRVIVPSAPANEFAAAETRCPPARTGRPGCVGRPRHLRVRYRKVIGSDPRSAEFVAAETRSRPAPTARARRRRCASATGLQARRGGPTRAGEAPFAERVSARRGFPRSQRRLQPLGMPRGKRSPRQHARNDEAPETRVPGASSAIHPPTPSRYRGSAMRSAR
jgi:hypothetical protein